MKVTADISNVMNMEQQLASALAKVSGELSHADFFDQEQRAEIYSILDALKVDTEAARATLGRWVSERGREVGDA